ncbi:acyloxyacyl hydrolase [Flavobacterium sp. LM5]|uniref:acyloxyacyl hydrolase n=1 Tax=Flavobacterium sp. LM5 TaxID=1938610 RepID=UPI000993C032|nr:acyloxyacyl hydrolase [Flavobacterium sp. LM5]
MTLRTLSQIFFLLLGVKSIAQERTTSIKNNVNFIGIGYAMGETIPSISIFPETKTQKGVDFTFGTTTFENDTWAKRLNYPKTGILLSFADFGNKEKVGYGISVIPFFDFGVLNSVTPRIRFQVGLGGSYNNVIYDKVTNPGNFGISTHFTWAFRSFLYYDLVHRKDFNLKIGGGFTHFSNGHTRLPNHGLNSYLATVKTELNFVKNTASVPTLVSPSDQSHTQTFYGTRLGLGQKVLARDYNALKNVYTSSFSVGRIKDKTFKYGVGFFYRFYDDYYDYIKEEGSVINTQFPALKNNPFRNASAIGLYTNFEVLIHHISIETELGINVYKPAFKLDWYLNNGSAASGVYIPKPFGLKAKTKQYISSRLGFRYYAITAKKAPQHNVFVAATINANLGQADFSELSFGYVYSPKRASK